MTPDTNEVVLNFRLRRPKVVIDINRNLNASKLKLRERGQ